MRILEILPELKSAGAQVMAENLVNELVKDGYEVRVASLYTIHTPISGRLERKAPVSFLDKKSGFDASVVFKLRKIIKEFQPDIIHTHTYSLKYAWMAATGTKIPIVHTIHNLAEKETTKANLDLERKLFQSGRVVPVSISPKIQESVMGFYGLSENSVPMVYNGIDLSTCHPKESYDFGEGEIRIIHLGRITPQKNHDLMACAMSPVKEKHPEAKLHFFGEAKNPEYFETLVQMWSESKSHENIVLEGVTDKPHEELAKADIFLLPSDYEGMPITLIEAMATGLPIIVTPVGGIPDMVKDGESALFCEDDIENLADKIITLIENKSLRERLGKEALKESARFSSKEMAAGYENIYKSLVK